jgi:cerevisin
VSFTFLPLHRLSRSRYAHTPAGKFSEDALNEIRRSPDVAYVEMDQIVHTTDDIHGVDDAFMGSDLETQKGAPWGLARISHRNRLTFGTFNKYEFNKNGGEGVTAYVIDTGVNIKHVEFEGRARWGKTIPRNDEDIDGNGHGTHCAGTVASGKYGVAKKAEIVAVKVLGSNGSGTMADVVSGVVWAAEDAAKKAALAARELALTGKTKFKGSVANMSLGGGKARSLDEAVDAAVESGLHFAVAAGNDNKDACDFSPAAAEGAVTVGASTITDSRAYFSNHGKCVDIFAPGLNILSTWTGSEDAVNTISGTSMASPHICGMLAYLLSIEGTETFTLLAGPEEPEELVEAPESIYGEAYKLLPEWAQTFLPEPENEDVIELTRSTNLGSKVTPKRLKKALIALATPGKLTDLPSGTVNLLAFNNATSS